MKVEAKVTTKNAHGFKTVRALELALYHDFGALPGPIQNLLILQGVFRKIVGGIAREVCLLAVRMANGK